MSILLLAKYAKNHVYAYKFTFKCEVYQMISSLFHLQCLFIRSVLLLQHMTM